MVNKLTSIKGFGEGDPKSDGGGARNRAIHAKMEGKKPRGNYSIFKYKAGSTDRGERIKHGLSHGEMHTELKSNPAYRGTDTHGFSGGRTYSRKK